MDLKQRGRIEVMGLTFHPDFIQITETGRHPLTAEEIRKNTERAHAIQVEWKRIVVTHDLVDECLLPLFERYAELLEEMLKIEESVRYLRELKEEKPAPT